MKNDNKVMALAIVLLLSASLISCGDKEKPIAESPSETTSSTTEQTTATTSETTTLTQESLTTDENKVDLKERLGYDYTELNKIFGEGNSSCPFTRSEYLEKRDEKNKISSLVLVGTDSFNEYDISVYDEVSKSTNKEFTNHLTIFYEKADELKGIIVYSGTNYITSKNASYKSSYDLGLIANPLATIYKLEAPQDNMWSEMEYWSELIYPQLESEDRPMLHNTTRIATDDMLNYSYQYSTTIINDDDACLIIKKSGDNSDSSTQSTQEQISSENADESNNGNSQDSFLKTEDFLKQFKEKMNTILGIDTLTFVKSEVIFDQLVSTNKLKSHYEFKNPVSDCTVYLTLSEKETEPGYLVSYTIEMDTLLEKGRQLKTVLFPEDNSTRSVEIRDYNLCVMMLPVAVQLDYNTKEELLQIYNTFEKDKYGDRRQTIGEIKICISSASDRTGGLGTYNTLSQLREAGLAE